MPEQNKFDLVVIGAGSGGVRAARWAAGLGAKVAIIEERFLGGTCVNVGCVPKKLFAYAAGLNQEKALMASFGISADLSLDWAQLRDNKTREIERLNGIYEKLLHNAGVALFRGHGEVVAEGRVAVGDTTLQADHILVATGGEPVRPDVPGAELAAISDDLFYLDKLPQKAVVVGGGYIACEFASILHGLGVQVTQLYRRELFLRGFDNDIRQFVADQMQAEGIDIRFNINVTAIREGEVSLTDGSVMATDQVFLATGRHAKVDGVFADDMAPELANNGLIKVDETFATSQKGIYAIGDVVGRMALTPVALEEGMWLADYLFGDVKNPPVDYSNIPTAVFCTPNISTVGLSQEDAQARYGKLRIYRNEFRPMRYSLSDINHRSLMKLIVDDASDKVVGVHMAGEDAAEMVQGLAIAVKMGATKADFDRTIGIHPTSAEEWVTMRTGETVS